QTAPDHLPSWVRRETIVLNEIIKDNQLRISICDIADAEKVVEFQAEHLSESETTHCSREFFCPIGLRFAIKRKQVIVVHENDKIVAMTRFYITKRYGHASLYQFAIAKSHRGKGLLLKMLDIIDTRKIVFKCFIESSLNEYFLKTNWTLSSQDNNFKYWVIHKES
ncbi:MAG: GNAT family N-acetyltransferase, partial [Fibrobacteres bacterium]|nr:GNAT family N-acetyltransferase [Fibrobacterota bacterium]